MSSKIHPTAIIHPKAVLEDVEVGAHAYIGPEVSVGKGTVIREHVYIEGWTKIGEENVIYPYAVIGTPPQDFHYRGEKSFVEIGSRNIIREFVTIHRASGEGEKTIVGNGVILANCAQLGGHVEVGDFAVVGGVVGVHQFCRIGELCIIGACSKVVMDVCPFLRADGHPVKIYGLNIVGLKRKNFPPETLKILKDVYKLLFRSSLTLKEAVKKVEEKWGEKEEVEKILSFIRSTKRGIHR